MDGYDELRDDLLDFPPEDEPDPDAETFGSPYSGERIEDK